MLPSTAWPSDLVAPRKASRPSSSSSRTSTSTPASFEILLATFSLFLASRIAAVATVLITSAPISWARRTCVVDHLGDLGDLLVAELSLALGEVLADPRVGALLHHLPQAGSSRARRRAARVVLEPMSIAAQSISLIFSEVADRSHTVHGIPHAPSYFGGDGALRSESASRSQRPVRVVALHPPPEGDRGRGVRLGPGALAPVVGPGRPSRVRDARERPARGARDLGAAVDPARSRLAAGGHSVERPRARGARLLRGRGRRAARRLPRGQLPRRPGERGRAARRDALSRRGLQARRASRGDDRPREPCAGLPRPRRPLPHAARTAHDGEADRLAGDRRLPRRRARSPGRLPSPHRHRRADRAGARPCRGLPSARQPGRASRRRGPPGARPGAARPAPAARPGQRPLGSRRAAARASAGGAAAARGPSATARAVATASPARVGALAAQVPARA